MYKLSLIVLCSLCCIRASAQSKTIISGVVKEANGKKISNARIFILRAEKFQMNIGGHPDAATLAEKGETIKVNTDGSFKGSFDNSLPNGIYFTADGEQTEDIYFPPNIQSIQVTATLYNDKVERDERIPGITTDNKIVNQYIKAHALSNLSIPSDVMKQMNASIDYSAKHGTLEGFTYDLSAYYKSMLDIYSGTADRSLKNYVLLNLSFLCVGNKYPVDQKYLIEAIQNTPPSDGVWLASSGAFVRGCYLGLGGFQKNKDLLLPFMEGLVDQCPVESEKPAQLYSLLYFANTAHLPEANAFYARLVNDYSTTSQAKMAIKRFPLQLKIDSGKELPTFALLNIDHPDSPVTNETGKGKILLIDFWATWCGPCVADLGSIDSAYNKYRGNDFEILSISMDKEAKDVETFRKKKWSMPWINALAGTSAKKISEDFEIFGIPKMILVDKNGKIITANQDLLYGDRLDGSLNKYLNKN